MKSAQLYQAQKEQVKNFLLDFKIFIDKLEELGLDIKSDSNKLLDAINTIDSDILSIALIGAFSDGKTTTIAGLLDEVKSNMKIDTAESSDEVIVYKPLTDSDKYRIVDTPGLFGEKEKDIENDIVKLSDITKKYISSAHIIFYVVDATNPLKDNHKETVRWILRDLNKLDTTVFIINKMDEVSDLTDNDDFNSQKEIKTNNVREKLKRFVDLTDEEVRKLNIVCIASNPQGRGLEEFWFQKKEEYIKRSRIDDLKNTTNKILEDSAYTNLICKTGVDVIKDSIENKLITLDNQLSIFNAQKDIKTEELKRLKEDLKETITKINRARIDFKESLISYREEIQRNVYSASPENIGGLLRVDIGVEELDEIDEKGNKKKNYGTVIMQKINLLADKQFNQVSSLISDLKKEVEVQIDNSNQLLEKVTANLNLQSININKDMLRKGVLEARNILGKMNIKIKFKPFGIKKLVNNLDKCITGAIIFLDAALKVYRVMAEEKREEEFKKLKEDLNNLIESIFNEVFKSLDSDNFIDEYAPQIKEIENTISIIEEEVKFFEDKYNFVQKWKVDVKSIFDKYKILEVDFEVIE